LAHPLVLDCNVYAGWELYPTDYTQWFQGVIYVVPKYSQFLTETEKSEIYDYIKLQDSFFTNFIFQDCTYIGIQVNVGIIFKSSSVTQTTMNADTVALINLVNNYFDLVTVVANSGTVFRNIYRSILETSILTTITDFLSVNVSLQTVETVSAIAVNETTFNYFYNYTTLDLNGTYLYINQEKVGTFNGSWVLVPQDNSGSGGTNWIGKINATINIITHDLIVNILDPTLVETSNPNNIIGRTIFLRSDPENGNDIFAATSGNMVFQFYNLDITNITF
ncbi:MAG: hypothetical protein ABSG25_12090, partial [Bryobacteraceae bacterium]